MAMARSTLAVAVPEALAEPVELPLPRVMPTVKPEAALPVMPAALIGKSNPSRKVRLAFLPIELSVKLIGFVPVGPVRIVAVPFATVKFRRAAALPVSVPVALIVMIGLSVVHEDWLPQETVTVTPAEPLEMRILLPDTTVTAPVEAFILNMDCVVAVAATRLRLPPENVGVL